MVNLVFSSKFKLRFLCDCSRIISPWGFSGTQNNFLWKILIVIFLQNFERIVQDLANTHLTRPAFGVWKIIKIVDSHFAFRHQNEKKNLKNQILNYNLFKNLLKGFFFTLFWFLVVQKLAIILAFIKWLMRKFCKATARPVFFQIAKWLR